MVQSVAPVKTVQTFEGYTVGIVCSAEHGCVQTQAKFCLRQDADGSWVLAFHDPNDPLRGWQQSGIGDGGGAEFFTELMASFAAIAMCEP